MSMRRPLRLSLVAGACALAFVSGAAGAQAAPSAGGADQVVVTGQRDPSAWLRAESPHFVVWSDTSTADASRLLGQLERLDALLRLYTASIRKADAGVGVPRLTLYYLDGTLAFTRFAPDAPVDAIGMVGSCAAGVLGVGVQVGPLAQLDDADLAKTPLEAGQSYLFEAYARHFLYRSTDVRAPAAFIEGMAKYFSAVRFSGDQMVVGRTPTGINRYLALLDEGHSHELDYGDVFARTYAPDPDANVDPRARAKQLEFEARAWTLVHYMLSTDERRARMPAFLDAVHGGRPAAQAFERSYGVKLADLPAALWRYRLTAKTLQVELPATPPAPVTTRTLSRSAGEFVQAEALRAGCPALPQGQALLRGATEQAARMSNSDTARAGAARIAVDWGDAGAVAQALPLLKQAAARDPQDAEAAYWLGRAELRLAGQDAAHDFTYLSAAQAELARANGLRPAESEFALARLQAALAARTEPDRPALDATLAAWRGARDNNTLAQEATLAYAWTGDPLDAGHVLQVLANDSRDAEAQAWARDWQARLEKGVTPAALFAEMRRLQQPGPAVKEWTIDQDSVAQDVERAAGFEAARKVRDWQSTAAGQPSTPLSNPQTGAPQR